VVIVFCLSARSFMLLCSAMRFNSLEFTYAKTSFWELEVFIVLSMLLISLKQSLVLVILSFMQLRSSIQTLWTLDL
jgi:hypothetical protein